MFSSRSRTDRVEHNLSILSIIICHSASDPEIASRVRFTAIQLMLYFQNISP